MNPSNKAQAKAISIINNWFDVANSRKFVDSRPEKSAFGSPGAMAQQEEALQDMENLMNNVIIMSKYAMLPCMKGVLRHIESLRQLKEELGDEVVMTSRLNSNCVENMFSQI